jgi:hypothetical protein
MNHFKKYGKARVCGDEEIKAYYIQEMLTTV